MEVLLDTSKRNISKKHIINKLMFKFFYDFGYIEESNCYEQFL